MFFDKQTNETVEEYMTRWLITVKKPTLKPTSFDRVELSLKYQIFPRIGTIKMKKLSSDDIQIMLNSLSEVYSHSTVKKAYVNLKSCLKMAEIREDIKKNPIHAVVLPRNTSPNEVSFYSAEQVQMIVAEAVSTYKNGAFKYRYGYLIVLLLNTGMRLGEALALQWEDVDWSNRSIHICKNVENVKSRNGDKSYTKIIQMPKSDKSVRRIPLNNNAMNALVKLNSMQAEMNCKLVVATENGNYVDGGNVRRTMQSILNNCGIHGKTDIVHALRHTFATLLIRRGVDIKTVSELLGHSDVTITMKFYYHVVEEQKNNAIRKLDDLY